MTTIAAIITASFLAFVVVLYATEWGRGFRIAMTMDCLCDECVRRAVDKLKRGE